MPTPSIMTPLGSVAPDFALADVTTGDTVKLSDFAGKKALLVVFMCNHCPYVQHVADGIAALGRDYDGSDVGMVAIMPNDTDGYPEDGPEATAAEVARRGYRFPYLYDQDQSVAAAYGAACTPDFFLYGPERTLCYRGRLDSSRPNSGIPVTGEDLRAAIEALRNDQPAPEVQYPSAGCSIKWRPGRHLLVGRDAWLLST